MTEPESFLNYQPYLAQIDTWPNDNGGAHVWDMRPQHAIAACARAS